MEDAQTRWKELSTLWTRVWITGVRWGAAVDARSDGETGRRVNHGPPTSSATGSPQSVVHTARSVRQEASVWTAVGLWMTGRSSHLTGLSATGWRGVIVDDAVDRGASYPPLPTSRRVPGLIHVVHRPTTGSTLLNYLKSIREGRGELRRGRSSEEGCSRASRSKADAERALRFSCPYFPVLSCLCLSHDPAHPRRSRPRL